MRPESTVHVFQFFYGDMVLTNARSKVMDCFYQQISNIERTLFILCCRMVNCARSEPEQNLLAFEMNNTVLYKTYKDIEEGTELLTYYGDDVSDNY